MHSEVSPVQGLNLTASCPVMHQQVKYGQTQVQLSFSINVWLSNSSAVQRHVRCQDLVHLDFY